MSSMHACKAEPGPGQIASQLPDFTAAGKYGARSSIKLHTTVTSGSASYDLSVLITQPATSYNIPAGFPVVLFFNGFQAQADWYEDIARYIASHGYVVVQYTLPALLHRVPLLDRLPLRAAIKDITELDFITPLLDFVRSWLASNGNSNPGAQCKVDFRRLAAVGHSRGGKLAALHYAKSVYDGAPIGTAVLLDPVDALPPFGNRKDYPSGAEALQAHTGSDSSGPDGDGATGTAGTGGLGGGDRSVCILGAGIKGGFNPQGEDYLKFFEAAGSGSWCCVVPRAGHMAFTSTGGCKDKLIKLIVDSGRSGGLSNKEVIALSCPVVVAWLDKTFRGADLSAFKAWLATAEEGGYIAFTEKQ